MRLFEAVGVVGEVDYSGDMLFVEYVIDREVVVLEVLASVLCYGGALSDEVRDSFFVVTAEWAFFGVGLLHVVKVFIQAAVSCYKVDCCPVV